MSNPLISVIVPVYKAEPYLQRCVDSIRNQTYSNLEIILVDDGSPDRCGEMCDALAKEDKRIRVIHKENGGLSSARNAGLDIASGAYIGFVDSDDWIDLNMYQVLYDTMVQQNAQISCCAIAYSDGDRVFAYMNRKFDESFTLDTAQAQIELTRNCRITNSVDDKLYVSSIWDGLRFREGALYEDAFIQHLCIHRAKYITYMAKPMYFYFQSPNSILRGNTSLQHYDLVISGEERIAFYKEHYPEAVDHAKAGHAMACMDLLYKTHSNPEWKEYRKKILRWIKENVIASVSRKMPARYRLKRTLLRLGMGVYVCAMDVYTKRPRK